MAKNGEQEKRQKHGNRACGNCNLVEDSDHKLKDCNRCKLVVYCDRACQAAHWKTHKPLCIAVDDRKPSKQKPPTTLKNTTLSSLCGVLKCVICLDILRASKTCTVPCGHTFHAICVSNLRSSGSLVCPLCRSDLPQTPEQNFILAQNLWYPVLIGREKKTRALQGAADTAAKEAEVMVEVCRLLTLAAKEGHIETQYSLGVVNDHGIGVGVDDKKAYDWYQKAAEQEHAEAQIYMGIFRQHGRGGTKNYNQAMNWYMAAALQGHADAEYNVGVMFEHGYGTEKNRRKAASAFVGAYEKGHLRALKKLEQFHMEDKENTKNMSSEDLKEQKREKLRKHLKDAKDGRADAQFILGRLFEGGDGEGGSIIDSMPEFQQNIKTAYLWYLKSAKQDFSAAQVSVGNFYENGYAVEKNYIKAFEWYMKGAKNLGVCSTSAQCGLGRLYEHGHGVETNYKNAFEWYSKAAELGHDEAQFKLGDLYMSGKGVEVVSTDMAVYWYLKASKQHSNFGTEAQSKLDALGRS